MDNTGRPRSGVDWVHTYSMLFTIILAGILAVGVAWLLRYFLHAILVFIVSGFLAFALTPLVDWLGRSTRLPRAVTTLLVYLAVLALIGAGGYWMGSQLVAQTAALGKELPQYGTRLEGIIQGVQNWLAGFGVRVNLNQELQGAAASLQGAGSEVLGRSVAVVRYLTTVVTDVVVVLFISLYLVLDSHRIGRGIRSLAPRRYAATLRFVQSSVTEVLGGYIRGQLTMALIVGVTVGVVCWLLRVPYPLVLGTLGFFFELIPMVGPVLIGVAVALVAAFQSFRLLVEVMIFYVVLQLAESNVLGPRITGQAVELPPVVSILAILGGAELGGILGALLAVPTVALIVRIAGAALAEWKARVDASTGEAPNADGTPREPEPIPLRSPARSTRH